MIDPQFMDLMGSPYLLAHGLGVPVNDATTKVAIPKAGQYRVWVRTKDWVAQWKAPGTPGRFQVIINDTPLETIFGTVGAQWHWQDGGKIDLPKGTLRLALHDLTGFEGRCDAILFSSDPSFVPPNLPLKTDDINRTILLNDGNGKIEEDSRWVGRGALPHIIEFRWDEPVKLGATRMIPPRDQSPKGAA